MKDPIDTIFLLLEQQRANLRIGPYTRDQLEKDREISASLRKICDQLPFSSPVKITNAAQSPQMLGSAVAFQQHSGHSQAVVCIARAPRDG